MQYEVALSKATGAATANDDFISKLQRVVQLTGFSDPVYAEAYVQVHQFDINLGACRLAAPELTSSDVLIVNQTTDTLQNLTVEFATLGDLKISERPSPHTLGPHSFQSIKTTVKVRYLDSLSGCDGRRRCERRCRLRRFTGSD